MKLFFTSTSPFARKVLVAAHELGLTHRIETMTLRPTPTKTDATLSKVNPLSKIPALVLDDGTTLYDSPVLCEYLESLREVEPTAGSHVERLTPRSSPSRFRVLKNQALADGVLDAAILVFYERSQRPKELHWEAWLSGQTEKVMQGLDALDAEADSFSSTPDVGQIAAACTLGWLEFRDVFGDIRATRPKLTRWYETFAQRPSMKATEPKA